MTCTRSTWARPGPNMRCPAGLVGRTQTRERHPRAAPSPAGSGVAAREPAPAAGRQSAAPRSAQRCPRCTARSPQNAAEHELRGRARRRRRPAPPSLATYGTDPRRRAAGARHPAAARRRAAAHAAVGVVADVGRGPRASARRPEQRRHASAATRGRTAAAAAGAGPARARPAREWPRAPAPARPCYKSWPGVPVQLAVADRGRRRRPPPPSDPPGQRLRHLHRPVARDHARLAAASYAAVGVYIGGVNSACAYGNLSAGWITSASPAMGWGMLPTYVGPQAPVLGRATGC